jgi:hypothetical protein
MAQHGLNRRSRRDSLNFTELFDTLRFLSSLQREVGADWTPAETIALKRFHLVAEDVEGVPLWAPIHSIATTLPLSAYPAATGNR